MSLKQLQNDTSLEQENNFIASLSEEGEISPTQRVSIYKNAYHARLVGVIDSDFPCLSKLLGDELYDPLCQAYISAHPSHQPPINNFGAQLPEFIRHFEVLKNQAIAIELCDLEWQLRTTFDAKNSVALPADYLQSIPSEKWPELTFMLSHGFNLRYFTMNTIEVWQALKSDETPEIKKLEQTQTWMIWRQGLVTQFRSVEVDEACLLIAVQDGQNFESLCELLLEWWPEEHVPERAFQLLQNWIGLGIFTQIWLVHFSGEHVTTKCLALPQLSFALLRQSSFIISI